MQPIDTLDYFHAYLRSRLPKDMTVAEFSRKSGISRSQVDGWIKDGIGAPGIDRLDKIAETLGCDVVDLLRPQTTPQPQVSGPKLVTSPSTSLLGEAVRILAGLDEHELRTVMPYIEAAKEMGAITRLDKNQKLPNNGS